MRIRLLAPGGRMPGWVDAGFEAYRRRMPPQVRLELVELPLGRRSKSSDPARAIAEEGERTLAALSDDDRLIALDEGGRSLSTRELADRLDRWTHEGRALALAVGGPDGLAPAVKQRAEETWSLSALTLPHGLVRVVVAEQIYRAWSLLSGHPYHRE